MSRHFTVNEVAEQLGVTPDKVTDWIRRGDLAAVNLALSKKGVKARYRISETAVERFLTDRLVPAAVSRTTTTTQTAPSTKSVRKYY